MKTSEIKKELKLKLQMQFSFGITPEFLYDLYREYDGKIVDDILL